jgi:hypothetical protein
MSDNVVYNNSLESFYVYRSLNSDETWGAVLADSDIRKLPNIDFGMLVFAVNEKEAIIRGRLLYEKIHAYDSDKENMRIFTAAVLKSASKHYIDKGIADGQINDLAKITTRIAAKVNEEFNKHFQKLQENESSAESRQDSSSS